MTAATTNENAINKLNKARQVDSEIGALLSDITEYIIKEDYRRALQATAYLLVSIAAKAGTKPFTALRSIYKAS